jgi:hypothetical protein
MRLRNLESCQQLQSPYPNVANLLIVPRVTSVEVCDHMVVLYIQFCDLLMLVIGYTHSEVGPQNTKSCISSPRVVSLGCL